jgi:hypothetical protein
LYAIVTPGGEPGNVKLGKLFIGTCNNGSQDFAYDCTGFGKINAGPRPTVKTLTKTINRGSRVYISPGPSIAGLHSILQYKCGIVINQTEDRHYIVAFGAEELDDYLAHPHVAKSCVAVKVPKNRIIAESVAASGYRSVFDAAMTLTASAVLAQDAWKASLPSPGEVLCEHLRDREDKLRALKTEVLSNEACTRGCCVAPFRNSAMDLAKVDEKLHAIAHAPLPAYEE